MRFEKSLLPNLRENNRARKKLRFWSLGCSSGQETYSIAFAIKRKFIGLDNWDINIVGTDISSLAISKAQKGLYNNFEVQTGLNAQMILDFFSLRKGSYFLSVSKHQSLVRVFNCTFAGFFFFTINNCRTIGLSTER